MAARGSGLLFRHDLEDDVHHVLHETAGGLLADSLIAVGPEHLAVLVKRQPPIKANVTKTISERETDMAFSIEASKRLS